MNEYHRIPMGHIPEPNQSAHPPTLVRKNTEDKMSVRCEKYQVYCQRWLILATCCVLALSNSMQWISYTTLTVQTNVFYCGSVNASCEAGYYTNQIFQVVAVVTGLGGMYITDHYGIRLSINCGIGFNIGGSIIRLISSLPVIDSFVARQALLHSGSVVVAIAQAFFLVLPSKIAECWFPENQRAIANVLSFIANPFGVVLGTTVPYFIFGDSATADYHNSYQLFVFNAIMFALAFVNGVMALFITRSMPVIPPSPSNAAHSTHDIGFWDSIKTCLLEKQFQLQLFTFAAGFAQLWGLMVILPDILQDRQYPLAFLSGGICALVGVGASLCAGYIVDRYKCFKEIIKGCSIFFAITAIVLRYWLGSRKGLTSDEVVVLLLCALLGAFSIPQFPIGIEMGVETTFPVFEATSSGLLVLSGQLWMFGLSAIFFFAKMVTCIDKIDEGSAVGNWRFALDIWCVISVIEAIIAFFFLNPYYKRIAYERDVEQRQTEEEDSNTTTPRH